jgi:hypothetical protein
MPIVGSGNQERADVRAEIRELSGTREQVFP